MKKFVVSVLAVLLLTACSSRIVLPNAEDICQVTVIRNGVQIVIDDETEIRKLLLEMRKAQDTGMDSTRDCSAEDRAVKVNFTFTQGGTSTLFLREENDRVILEQPFQKIYETDKSILNFLR